MFVVVPAIDGIPQIGNPHLYFGMSISPNEAVCHVSDGPIEEGWVEITEAEFNEYVPDYIPQTDPMPQPETTEQKLARLEEQNLILMDALATTFEELLALRELVEGE